ncbi:MAG: UbiA prenyltransferase family protein [Euryarchaeota archaeon]|nr:UbiA prenyltransferase family protein [Euryarchaeota archaeon]
MMYELLSLALMYTAVPMLAYGVKSYDWDILRVILLSILTLFSGYIATLIWNDISDMEIDKIAHPDRTIPSGRITPKQFFIVALIFSAMVFTCAILISVWCLFIVGMAALFVAFHNKFLKKIVKIPAYSEIFTPIQWVTVAVFGYVAIWTALPQSHAMSYNLPVLGAIAFDADSFINMILLVLFTYFADDAHDLPEGIHDIDGDRKLGVRTYASSFRIKTSAKVSFAMYFISGILGVILFFRTILSPIFLIPFLIIWLYTLSWSYRYLKKDEQEMKDTGLIIGQKGFNYFLTAFDLMFLDILLQLLYTSFWAA